MKRVKLSEKKGYTLVRGYKLSRKEHEELYELVWELLRLAGIYKVGLHFSIYMTEEGIIVHTYYKWPGEPVEFGNYSLSEIFSLIEKRIKGSIITEREVIG
jgi:hypothetical protein